MPDTTLTAVMGEQALPNIDPEFIVICASAWMNETGFGIGYDWDGERFNNRNDAIKHGWKTRHSDDFNIGQTYGDDLIWFGWQDQRMMASCLGARPTRAKEPVSQRRLRTWFCLCSRKPGSANQRANCRRVG